MRRMFEFFLIFLFFFPDTNGLMGQSISRKNLFEQDSIINLFLYAHLKNIDHNNQKDVKRPGF
ncbi:MAG: hypothetical protein MUE99_07860, partial [Chitinophagaceae bacterium]|nr:hypothetical protein [Chitinophagaceae bacterium]